MIFSTKKSKRDDKLQSDRRLLKKSKLFNVKWYLETYPDVKGDPIRHYLEYGWKEHRNPAPVFITDLYLQRHPDVWESEMNPLVHYIRWGIREKRNIGYPLSEYKTLRKSGLFDKKWYREQYGDACGREMDPIIHYLLYGWEKGYNPSRKFDTNFYLTTYPDVAKAHLCPLLHYVRYGRKEGRPASNGSGRSASVTSVNCERLLSPFLRAFYRFACKKQIERNKCVRIAVHVHLFYENLWGEIKRYLSNLTCYQFDLFVTSPRELSVGILKDIYEFREKANVWVVENRGFDLGPFVYFLHKIDLQEYDIIFKIHTKRDIVARNYCGTYMKGGEWRRMLYEAILGERTVHKTVDYLSSDNRIGLISHKCLISDKDILFQKEETMRAMKAHGFGIPEKYQFIIGTMFAGRAELFRAIREKSRFEDFAFSTRGEFTLAHSYERVLSLNALYQGFSLHGNNTFRWNALIRRFQAVLHPYDPPRFYNSEMIKKYQFYYAEIASGKKKYFISSLLKEKNEQIYNALVRESGADLQEIQPLSETSISYHFLLKELVSERVVARITSPLEITTFKLVGDEILVEKRRKQKWRAMRVLRVCKQSPVFVTRGRYLLDVLAEPLLAKDTKELVRLLVPYCACVFDRFRSGHRTKMLPDSWDAIPRNTIIDERGRYCFFDCNIRYLAGVAKSYFLYRVVVDLRYSSARKGVAYSSDEMVKLYDSLCSELKVDGHFKKDAKLERYLQKSLKRKGIRFRIIRDIFSVISYRLGAWGMFAGKRDRRPAKAEQTI